MFNNSPNTARAYSFSNVTVKTNLKHFIVTYQEVCRPKLQVSFNTVLLVTQPFPRDSACRFSWKLLALPFTRKGSNPDHPFFQRCWKGPVFVPGFKIVAGSMLAFTAPNFESMRISSPVLLSVFLTTRFLIDAKILFCTLLKGYKTSLSISSYCII